MASLSENTPQNSRKKRIKVSRSRSTISRKVIAFEEIVSVKSRENSERRAADLLDLPRTTIRSWRDQTKDHEELGAFLKTPVGASFLKNQLLATMKSCKCGSSGIRGVQEYLRLTGLDRFVASSNGALQKFWEHCEEAILKFGEEQEKKLTSEMRHRKITLGLDEMFRGRRPCLVAIEVVSNYILLEKFTEDRRAETWKESVDERLKGFNVDLHQIVSDLCGGIRSYAKAIGAEHSPDLFHSQQELSRATSASLASQKRSAQKMLDRVKENLEKTSQEPTSIVVEKRKCQKDKIKETELLRDKLEIDLANKQNRQKEAQEAIKELGDATHPIDLNTGKLQTVSAIEERFDKQFDIIQTCADEANLSSSCFQRLEKARRAFSATVDYLKFFFVFLEAFINDLTLTPTEEQYFRDIIFPLSYFRLIWKKASKRVKEKYQQTLNELEEKIRAGPWTEEQKSLLMKAGKELAEVFQRSSSCVEGRNGVLSLNHHRFHRLNSRSLKALTIVHNFDVRRSDGTTAAERFFGKQHDNLFEFLIANVRIPGQPWNQKNATNKRLVA